MISLPGVTPRRSFLRRPRQDITYTIATSGVITDSGGNIVYNLFQQDMTALRVVMRMGWNIPNPPNWVNQNDSTRYPFAVLTS